MTAHEPDASWKRCWRDDSATDPLMSAHVNRRQLGNHLLPLVRARLRAYLRTKMARTTLLAPESSGVLSRVSGGFRI